MKNIFKRFKHLIVVISPLCCDDEIEQTIEKFVVCQSNITLIHKYERKSLFCLGYYRKFIFTNKYR